MHRYIVNAWGCTLDQYAKLLLPEYKHLPIPHRRMPRWLLWLAIKLIGPDVRPLPPSPLPTPLSLSFAAPLPPSLS